MRRFSNFQALLFSFFSPDVYRDAARQWRGAGLVYVLLLAAIVAIWTTLRIQFAASTFASDIAPQLIDQLPTITIENGRLGVDRPGPILIQDPKTGTVLAIIDTTAEATALDGSSASLLVTRDRIVYRKSASETRMFELAAVKHFVFTRDLASRWVQLAATFLAALLFPFILIGVYVWRLVQLMFVSLVTLLVARVRGVVFDFAATMRLAAVAMTPATLVLDIVGLLGARVPFSGWLWCAFTTFCVVIAVNACREAPAAPQATPAPTA